MWTYRVLLVALILVPSAQACSLAYSPFDQPTWDDHLRFVDGDTLVAVQNGMESVEATGFFLSYAPADGRVLVAGQDGLGADCSGEGWLRLMEGDAVVWERSGHARVWPHADGPRIQYDDTLWRLDGEDLVPLEASVPEGRWILGWSHDDRPIYRDGGGVVIGEEPLEGGIPYDEPAAAAGDTTGILFSGEERAQLHLIVDSVEVVEWGVQEGWNKDLAWADGWYAVVGGQGFYIDAGTVTELGVDAVSVGVRGAEAIVFSEDGYTVFRDGQAVEAASRIGGTWIPSRPQADPQEVDSESSTGSLGEPEEGTAGTPATGPVAMLALVAAWAAFVRMRREPQ